MKAPDLRLKFLSDTPDQAFFIGVFFIGLFSITLLKQALDAPVFAAFIAITLIVSYGFVSKMVLVFRLTTERIGDNCYYLGFLFTLISLSNSLYLFSKENDPSAIVSDFGIALASTIAGILMRIVFNQMRVEGDVLESKVRETLTDTSIRLTAELENVMNEIGRVSGTVNNLMQESLKSTEKLLEESLKKTENVLADSVNRHNRLGESIQNLTDEIINQNRDASSQIVSSIKKIDQSNIESLNEPLNEIKKSLSGLASKINDSNVSLPEKSIEKFADSINTANSKIKELSGLIETEINAGKGSRARIIKNLIYSLFDK